jgi:hypothetical protein
MNEDLYCLGYTMCLSNEELIKFLEDDSEKFPQIQSVPKDVNLNKLFVMVLFCFMCQVAISLFILLYYIKISDKFYFVSW